MRGREGRKRRRGEGGDSKCERATEGVREGRRGQGKRRRIEESREMGGKEEGGAPVQLLDPPVVLDVGECVLCGRERERCCCR